MSTGWQCSVAGCEGGGGFVTIFYLTSWSPEDKCPDVTILMVTTHRL